MSRKFGTPPSAQEIEAIARSTLLRLPPQFKQHLGRVVLVVEDFASDEVIADMGLEGPYGLSGLYEGIPLTEESIEHSGAMPPRVWLYRLPILAEWAEREGETLERLVAHVTIHEIGHHFGLSDEDMHALEEMAG